MRSGCQELYSNYLNIQLDLHFEASILGGFNVGEPNMYSVKKVASLRRVTPAAIYARIKDMRGVGEYFKHIPGKGYFISREDYVLFYHEAIRDMTDYPKIFDCYWGSWRLDMLNCDKVGVALLIQNRNDFVKNFNVRSISRRTPLVSKSRALDHVEAYNIKDRDDVLVISSPYAGDGDSVEAKNWFKMPPMYAPDVLTFGFWRSENLHLYKAKK